MTSFILAPDADEDVFQIWAYLFTRAGVEIANRVEADFTTLSLP
jgi:plasmid stabilization system protein ParE